jgi:hypothetical protein
VLGWIIGEATPPPEFDTPLLARLSAAPRAASARADKAT